jgi:hypothetical protein
LATPSNTTPDQESLLRKAGEILTDLVYIESLTTDSSYHRALFGYLTAVNLLESNHAGIDPLLRAYGYLQLHLSVRGHMRSRDKIIKRGRMLLSTMSNHHLEKKRGSVAFFEGMIGLGFAMQGQFETALEFLASALALGDQLGASYSLSELNVWQIVIQIQSGSIRQATNMLHEAQYYHVHFDPTDLVTKRRFSILSLLVHLYTSTDSSLMSTTSTATELNSVLQSLQYLYRSTVTIDDLLALAVSALFQARQGNLANCAQLLHVAYTTCQVALKAAWSPVIVMASSLLMEASLRSWLTATVGQQKEQYVSAVSVSNMDSGNMNPNNTYNMPPMLGLYDSSNSNQMNAPNASDNHPSKGSYSKLNGHSGTASTSSGIPIPLDNRDPNLLPCLTHYLQISLATLHETTRYAPYLKADLAFAEAVMTRIQTPRCATTFRQALLKAVGVAKRYQRRWWEGMAAAQSYSVFGDSSTHGSSSHAGSSTIGWGGGLGGLGVGSGGYSKYGMGGGGGGGGFDDFRVVEKELGCVYMPFPLIVASSKAQGKNMQNNYGAGLGVNATMSGKEGNSNNQTSLQYQQSAVKSNYVGGSGMLRQTTKTKISPV